MSDLENEISRHAQDAFVDMNRQFVRTIEQALDQHLCPHILMRPRLCLDGNHWCALYGENLHDGVAGFGDSPARAMADFDRNWFRCIGATETSHD